MAGRKRISLDLRIAEKFSLADNGCWIWIASMSNAGYGRIRMGKVGNRQAHRVIWETFVGPIPAGFQLDHLCRNRACVNPDHLEIVTCKENLLRGNGWAGRNARKTHCKRGHPLTPGNVYLGRGYQRECKTCKLARERARYHNRRMVLLLDRLGEQQEERGAEG